MPSTPSSTSPPPTSSRRSPSRWTRWPPTLRRPLFLIAESDLNDPRLVRSRDAGGYGLDAAWADEWHHALHADADRRSSRLLRGLRAAAAAGQGTAPGVGVRRHLLPVPPADPRPAADGPVRQPVRGVHPEPRPGRQPRRRRAQRRPDERRPAPGGRRPAADLAVRADAVPGRGVGRHHAVPVLHRPPGSRPRPGRQRRAAPASSPPSAGTRTTCPIRRTRRRSSAPGSTGPSPARAATPAFWPGIAG